MLSRTPSSVSRFVQKCRGPVQHLGDSIRRRNEELPTAPPANLRLPAFPALHSQSVECRRLRPMQCRFPQGQLGLGVHPVSELASVELARSESVALLLQLQQKSASDLRIVPRCHSRLSEAMPHAPRQSAEWFVLEIPLPSSRSLDGEVPHTPWALTAQPPMDYRPRRTQGCVSHRSQRPSYYPMLAAL